MTGFAQQAGSCGVTRWAWEFKTLNAKGLDLRMRLPPGLDTLEAFCRQRVGTRLARGTCTMTLTLLREASTPRLRLNTTLLDDLPRSLAKITLPATINPATLDGLLGRKAC